MQERTKVAEGSQLKKREACVRSSGTIAAVFRSLAMKNRQRRDILRLLGVSGVSFASGLWGCASTAPGSAPLSKPATPVAPPKDDFFFLQLSDTHWGFSGAANPEAETTLRHAVATINSVATRPDFVIFTGDLTHSTDDPAQRRERMKEFKSIVSELAVKDVRFIPGEHDASLDGGEAYREFFGATHYAFEHKELYFIALDNVSAPGAVLGDDQLAWLAAEVARVPKSRPLVVFAHRPLFELFPSWDWATKDGARALEILQQHPLVTVFYGHIHQEHTQQTGSITHRAARSLIFPMPKPGSVPKKAPLEWDPKSSDHGLGYREVALAASQLRVRDLPLK